MRARLLILGLTGAIAACNAPAPTEDAGVATVPPRESRDLTPWSRRAGAAASNAGAEIAAPAPTSADRAALEELLAAAPKEPPKSTGEDGGTAIGTATNEPDAGATDAGPHKDATRKAEVEVGEMQIQPSMSSPAVERVCRQELYWTLVTRCRDKSGAILPPDAVKLDFLIDPDGFLVSSSILASTENPAFEEAARCMRRELSATTFRAPATARGMSTHVTATVPSVD